MAVSGVRGWIGRKDGMGSEEGVKSALSGLGSQITALQPVGLVIVKGRERP
jgi:hypothetical protein